MSDGSNMLNDMEFERELEEAQKRGDLSEFNARQIWQMRKQCAACQSNMTSKKMTTTISAVTAGVISGISSFFNLRGGG